MTSCTIKVVLAGDKIETDEYGLRNKRPTLGPGLLDDAGIVTVCKSGPLKHRPAGNTLWIDNSQKRYIAMKGDSVIGIVTAKQGDTFRVDIGASDAASLSYLSFEGATKKNRPDVKVGDIVYGKLLVANKFMEPELVCIDGHGKSNGMGVIRDGGNLIHLNLRWARRLLSKECLLLKIIGDQIPFESTVGMNGRVWVKGRSLDETLIIGKLIQDGERVNDSVMRRYVQQTMSKLLGVNH